MDIALFVMISSAFGMFAMLSFRAWEISHGVVIHKYPQAILRVSDSMKVHTLRIRDMLLDIWFERLAPPLARVWIYVVRTCRWSVIKKFLVDMYHSVRGSHAHHVNKDGETSASDFLNSMTEHKKKKTGIKLSTHIHKKKELHTEETSLEQDVKEES